MAGAKTRSQTKAAAPGRSPRRKGSGKTNAPSAPSRTKRSGNVAAVASPTRIQTNRRYSGEDAALERDVESSSSESTSDEEGEDILGGDYSDCDDNGESIDSSEVAECPDGHSQQPSYNNGSSVANTYISTLETASGLHIAERRRVERAFEDHGELGLFSLFVTREFKSRIQGWTNECLKRRGQPEMTDFEFDAYIGLELAMSICPLSEISEFWSEKRFLGQQDFSRTMPRARFQSIRGQIKLHPLDMTSGDGKDPLWHSRIALEHMQTKFVQIATPYGASSFDECTVRTKTRTRAKTYMPSKPDKYGIRFYASVGWKSLYIHSIWDNGSGNWTKVSPVARYTKLFPSLTAPVNRTLSNPDIRIEKKSASALWVAMMGHQALSVESPSGGRLMVTDNFYTRHALAKALLTFSDGETKLVGTIREKNVEKTCKPAVAASIERAETAPRGFWELIAIPEQEAGYYQRKNEHTKAQRSVPKSQRKAFPPAVKVFAPNAGYIVFKDRKVVLFYTNDLRKTPSKLVSTVTDADAIDCVHGLFPIKRWTGKENLHKKTFMVPAVIAAYNSAMNGVDRVDQLRSTNPTRRKEMRLPMSIFTWVLDMCVINAYALFREVMPPGHSIVPLREFKRRIAEQLTAKQLAKMELKRTTKRKNAETSLTGVVGGILSGHILTPNSTAESDGQLKCLLCRMRGLQKRSRYGCAECQVGFHVECFAAYHFQDVFLQASTPSVREALDIVCASATGNTVFKTRTKKNKSITSVEKLHLPQPSTSQRSATH